MSEHPANAMKTRLRADLRKAITARETDQVSVIRTLVAALDNAEAPAAEQTQPPDGPHDFQTGSAETRRLDLTLDRIAEVIAAEAREREAAALEMERLGQTAEAERLRAEARIARQYLEP